MASRRRAATHAGSWYSSQSQTLNTQLATWLNNVPATSLVEDGAPFEPPIQRCKAIIAPHAGYSYSGPAAAWAYKSLAIAGIKRVFILGPSHHVYLDGCALSACTEYETPIGNLPLDLRTIQDLKKTGMFSDMDLSTDEDEHSIEMHLPYVRKIFENVDIEIVPILIGGISQEKEAMFGKCLAPYLQSEDTVFVVSSDFCHWGVRFSYTFYYASEPPTSGVNLTRNNASVVSSSFPIYKSISALDHEGMSILAGVGPGGKVHDEFASYLQRTKNTICGRHPIGVLLGALESIESDDGTTGQMKLRWVRYEQSSENKTLHDSSVSYASAYVTM